MSADAVLVTLGVLGLLLLLAGVLAGDALDALLPLDLLPGLVPAAGAVLAAFGFGAALLGRTDGLGTVAAYGLAGAAAAGVGGATLVGARALVGGQAPMVRANDLLGLFGDVISPIPAGGFGEVSLLVHGSREKRAARADRPLPKGTQVYVLEVLSETAVHVAALDAPLETPLEGTP